MKKNLLPLLFITLGASFSFGDLYMDTRTGALSPIYMGLPNQINIMPTAKQNEDSTSSRTLYSSSSSQSDSSSSPYAKINQTPLFKKEVYVTIQSSCFGFDVDGQALYGGAELKPEKCIRKNNWVKWDLDQNKVLRCYEIDSKKNKLNAGQPINLNICRILLPEIYDVQKSKNGQSGCFAFSQEGLILNERFPINAKNCIGGSPQKSSYELSTEKSGDQTFLGCGKSSSAGSIVMTWAPIKLCSKWSTVKTEKINLPLPKINWTNGKIEPVPKCVQVVSGTKLVLWNGSEFSSQDCK